MKLPTHAARGDIAAICQLLMDKPEGTSNRNVAAVLDEYPLRRRNTAFCKPSGVIKSDGGGRMKFTRQGPLVALNEGRHKTRPFPGAMSGVPWYMAAIKSVVSRGRLAVTAPQESSRRLEHFPSEVTREGATRSSQSDCLLRLMERAGPGRVAVAKPGRSKRPEFNSEKLREFVEKYNQERANAHDEVPQDPEATATSKDSTLREVVEGKRGHEESKGWGLNAKPETEASRESVVQGEVGVPQRDVSGTGRICITRGGNNRILDQVGRPVAYGKLEAVVDQSLEPSARALQVMRSCRAAVIHAHAYKALRDENGNEVRRTDENALVESGTAMGFRGCNVTRILKPASQRWNIE